MNVADYQFIDALKALPFVNHVYLYGSRARGDHRPRSDIDLAIDCPDATSQDWREVLDIIDSADTLLAIDILRLDEQDSNSALYTNIMRDKVAL